MNVLCVRRTLENKLTKNMILQFLRYNEPLLNVSDGFIKRSRFQSTQVGHYGTQLTKLKKEFPLIPLL